MAGKTAYIWQVRQHIYMAGKTAFQPLKSPQIPFSPSFAVTKPLMLSSIPFKTINIIPFRSQKCKKNGKIFLKIFENRRFFKFEKSPIFKYFFQNLPNFFSDFFCFFETKMVLYLYLYYYIIIFTSQMT